jgi:hypothetical protein
VHLGPAFVADKKALELVKPGERAFDDPAVATEAGAMLGLAAGDHRLNASSPKQAAVRVVVVAAVGDHALGATTRSSWPARDGRHVVEQRDQLGDVVAIAARDGPGEREPRAVDEEVVLGAGTASVDRARARFGAPFFAWI